MDKTPGPTQNDKQPFTLTFTTKKVMNIKFRKEQLHGQKKNSVYFVINPFFFFNFQTLLELRDKPAECRIRH